MIDKPLYGNPLAGGLKTLQPGIIDDPFKPKSDDPLMQGYYDSDFYSDRQTADSIPYTYDGKEMRGSSSGASNLKKYLESIGKGDLIQFPEQNLMSVELQQAENPPPLSGTFNGMPLFPEQGVGQVDTPEQLIESGQFTPGVGQDIFGNNPAEIAVPSNPYNRVGQQLMGPNQFDDQFSSMGDRLTKLEEGIASLLNQNKGFGFNSMQPKYGAPNYGYSPFSMTGLGSLFGGYYG